VAKLPANLLAKVDKVRACAELNISPSGTLKLGIPLKPLVNRINELLATLSNQSVKNWLEFASYSHGACSLKFRLALARNATHVSMNRAEKSF